MLLLKFAKRISCFGFFSVSLIGCSESLSIGRSNWSSRDSSVVPNRIVEHYFGFVVAGSNVEHKFEITNDTDETWTIVETRSDCTCTVAKLTRDVIPPNETLEIDVGFNAPESPSNDVRKVGIFRESKSIDPIFLLLKARVRKKLNVSPVDLGVHAVGRGEQRFVFFDVENFSKESWDGINIESDCRWFSSTATQADLAYQEDGPVQRWRVTCKIDAADVEHGDHRGRVIITGGGLREELPFVMRVVSPVVAIPAQVFFGSVDHGKKVQKSISLKFASGMERNLDEIRVQCPQGLSARLVAQGDETIELIIELEDISRLEGDSIVIVEFANEDIPALNLPVYAFASETR